MIVRNPQRERGDLHGTVRLLREGEASSSLSSSSSSGSGPVAATGAAVAVQSTVEALVQFKRSATLCGKSEYLVEHIYLESAVHYFSVLSGYKEEVTAQNLKDMAGIACEYVSAPISSNAARSMKVYLLPGYEDGTNDDADSDVVKEWRSDTRTMLEESSKMGYGGGEGGSEDADKGKNDSAGGGESGGAEVAVVKRSGSVP